MGRVKTLSSIVQAHAGVVPPVVGSAVGANRPAFMDDQGASLRDRALLRPLRRRRRTRVAVSALRLRSRAQAKWTSRLGAMTFYIWPSPRGAVWAALPSRLPAPCRNSLARVLHFVSAPIPSHKRDGPLEGCCPANRRASAVVNSPPTLLPGCVARVWGAWCAASLSFSETAGSVS